MTGWEKKLWERARRDGGPLRRLACFVTVFLRGAVMDTIWTRSGYLTYLSLLHMVPLGAVALSLSARLGWKEFLVDWIRYRLSPTAPELSQKLIDAMLHLDLVALGFVGLVGVVVAGLIALTQLEHDFNHIWVVKGRPRWWRPLALYPLVIFVAPTVVAVAVASGALAEAQSRLWIAELANTGPVGHWLYGWLTNLPVVFHVIPYVVTWMLFTAFYYLMPSGPVRPTAAIFGGVLGAVIWQFVQSIYLSFQFGASTFAQAWGYLAQIPLLLLWLYISWVIVFLGAELAFAWQYRRAYMPKSPIDRLSHQTVEWAVVETARSLIDLEGRSRRRGTSTAVVSWKIGVPWRLVDRIAKSLYRIGAADRARVKGDMRYWPTPQLRTWTPAELLERWKGYGDRSDQVNGLSTDELSRPLGEDLLKPVDESDG